MVIGNGLIATEFLKEKNDSLIIFASGVSNSKTNDVREFNREEALIREYIDLYLEKTFVYFSTYSINDNSLNDSPYVKHKLRMEEIIKERHGDFAIIRTSNIVGADHKNNNTIFNFIFNKIKNNEKFDLWTGAIRNVLELRHLYLMVIKLIESNYKNDIFNIVNPVSYTLIEIVSAFEKMLSTQARYNIVDAGSFFEFDKEISCWLFQELNIPVELYLERAIKKYYIQ